MQEVGVDGPKEKKTLKKPHLWVNTHLEIQHLIILSFDFSLQIILISLPQSVLSGKRIANRSAAKKRTFLSHHHCKSPRLSQSNPPTSRNMSAGVADLLPRKFPFLPKHCATKFSDFPEPQNSKCHGQCQGYDLNDERREGSASAAVPS